LVHPDSMSQNLPQCSFRILPANSLGVGVEHPFAMAAAVLRGKRQRCLDAPPEILVA
jgi:hypothetical protein